MNYLRNLIWVFLLAVLFVFPTSIRGQNVSAKSFIEGIATLEAFRTMVMNCSFSGISEKELHATSALLYMYRRSLQTGYDFPDGEIDAYFDRGRSDGLNVKCESVKFQYAMNKYRGMINEMKKRKDTYEALANAQFIEPYR